jgi:hypothetical protein
MCDNDTSLDTANVISLDNPGNMNLDCKSRQGLASLQFLFIGRWG